MAEMVVKNFKVTPQLEAEINANLLIHNGRCNGPAWTFSDFVRNAVEAYCRDLMRGREHSQRRTARKRERRAARVAGAEGATTRVNSESEEGGNRGA